MHIYVTSECHGNGVYSKTSKQSTHWGQYKFSCCVLCGKALFSEVQKYGETNYWDLEKCHV